MSGLVSIRNGLRVSVLPPPVTPARSVPPYFGLPAACVGAVVLGDEPHAARPAPVPRSTAPAPATFRKSRRFGCPAPPNTLPLCSSIICDYLPTILDVTAGPTHLCAASAGGGTAETRRGRSGRPLFSSGGPTCTRAPSAGHQRSSARRAGWSGVAFTR